MILSDVIQTQFKSLFKKIVQLIKVKIIRKFYLRNSSIIEDQTKIYRAFDRMLKSMPNFNGESYDNSETWILRVKNFLEYGDICY